VEGRGKERRGKVAGTSRSAEKRGRNSIETKKGKKSETHKL